MQVLYLQEHHSLLTLRLRPQLLHLDVYVAVDLLEQEDVLGVEVGLLRLDLGLQHHRLELGDLLERVRLVV